MSYIPEMRRELAVVLVLVIGCGTFGEGSMSATDAAAPPADDGGAEVEGSVADASSTEQDSGFDANRSPADILASPCSQLFFCDDFERTSSSDVQGNWTTFHENLGAALKLGNTGTSTVLSVGLLQEASDGREAALGKALDVMARRVAIGFKLLVSAHPPDSDVVIADIRTQTGHVYVMLRGPNKLVVGAQAHPSLESGGEGETTIQANAWRDIVLDYRAGASPSADLTVVDQTKNTLTVAITKGAGDAGEVKIGCAYATGGAPASYAIDDVKIARVP